jgi:hypothetical protein
VCLFVVSPAVYSFKKLLCTVCTNNRNLGSAWPELVVPHPAPSIGELKEKREGLNAIEMMKRMEITPP